MSLRFWELFRDSSSFLARVTLVHLFIAPGFVMDGNCSQPIYARYDPTQTKPNGKLCGEEKQVFKADPRCAGRALLRGNPAANVTGSLHMGHAFENAPLIDTLVRYQRMVGRQHPVATLGQTMPALR